MQKILVVIHDRDSIPTLLEKALLLAKDKNFILEVLYVHEEALFDVPDYFRPQRLSDDGLIDKAKIKKEIVSQLKVVGAPDDVAVFVYINDTEERIHYITREDHNVLLVTAFHPKVTKKLVAHMDFPIVIIKTKNKFKHVIVPVDLSSHTDACIEQVREWFSQSAIELLYDFRYVVDISLMDIDYLGVPTAEPILDMQLNEQIREEQKSSFEALKKRSGLRGTFIEEEDSIVDDLSTFINKGGYDLAYVCAKKREHWLDDSLSLSLLEMVKCDLFVDPIS